MPKPRLSQEEFISRVHEVWGDRWDLSRAIFEGTKSKVVVVCPLHGEFQQTPLGLFRKSLGCPGCLRTKSLTTTEEFISRCQKFGEACWDYSSVEYRGMHSVVVVVCQKHGPFEASAGTLARGKAACAGCLGRDRQSRLDAAHSVWGDRWDYSDSDMSRGNLKLVEIGCREHGPFKQAWKSHIRGSVGCPTCNGLDSTTQLGKAHKVWGDRWDYSYVVFGVNGGGKKTIICREHGPFQQMWPDHLRGCVGCSSCSNSGTSEAESSIFEYVQSLAPSSQQGVRGKLSNPKLELDIYIPELNLAVEYNGLYWHNEEHKGKAYHADKTMFCREQGIRLVHVWEDDWLERPEIVSRTLGILLGTSQIPKIPARKTVVRPIAFAEAGEFLDTFHIQGSTSASIYIGTFFKEELVGVTTFKRRKDGSLELSRYATSKNVQGGHSKVVSYLEKNYEYTHLVTFADLSYSDGNLYRITGWTEDGMLPPDYTYVVGNRRVHKFTYRKSRFKSDPQLLWEEGLTERELADLNGLSRIYDAGKIRFIKPHP